MKPTIILLSVLAGALTWWWLSQPGPRQARQATAAHSRIHRFARSLLTVVVVYFVLMATAMLWLLLTTSAQG